MAAMTETVSDVQARPGVAPHVSGTAPVRGNGRRRVLDAAIACFTRNGFHGTSMQEICAEAGMSPGGIYRHFPSKEEMILAIVDEERSARVRMLELLREAPSFLEGILAMARALFTGELSMICVDLGPDIAGEAARNPRLKARFDEVEAEISGAIREAFLAGRARGEIDPAIDVDTALMLIDAIGDGLILRRRLAPDLPLAAMLPGIGALVARMLAPPASPAPSAPVDFCAPVDL